MKKATNMFDLETEQQASFETEQLPPQHVFKNIYHNSSILRLCDKKVLDSRAVVGTNSNGRYLMVPPFQR